MLALSRTVQAHLSIAQPAIAALVAARGIPPVRVMALGFVAAWSGLHAVFALNDLVDHQLDRARFAHLKSYRGFDVDAAIVRHPLAQGYLRRRHAMVWILALGGVALVLALELAPMSALLLGIAVVLEVGYCVLARVSAWKVVLTGVMVGLGALAGWFPVTSETGWGLVVVFGWMALWEIGGRNVVNDWADLEEDRVLGVRTVPSVAGPQAASRVVLAGNVGATVLGMAVAGPAGLPWWYVPVAGAVGLVLLVAPSVRLARTYCEVDAHRLFNRASFYPPVMMVAVGAGYVLVDWTRRAFELLVG
ncbi:MAG: UbiA prenyltransferase family protein [Acidimicrobiia bacterium]|nr:UbiA prenyltransferase family protein [Acidimicrobiia bacterium]